MKNKALIDKIFLLSEDIRYVAVYRDRKLVSFTKPGLDNTSDAESDKYEELLVNPTLLKLVQQRGDIDCGGLEFVLIRYGHFYQYVRPIQNGHISVCIEPQDDPLKLAALLQKEVTSSISSTS